MATKETGEQKLLKIIESQKLEESKLAVAGASPAAVQVAAAVKASGLGAPSFPSFFNPILDLLKGKSSGSARDAFGLKATNKFLVILTALMAIFFAVNIIHDTKVMKKGIVFSVDTSGLSSEIASAMKAPKDLSEYLTVIGKR